MQTGYGVGRRGCALLLILTVALLMGGCAVKKQSSEKMTREEMEAFLPDMPPLQTDGIEADIDASVEERYDLEALVAERAEVRAGKAADGSITCTVTAPDMYTMMKDYVASGRELTVEAYYAAARDYLESPDCPMREVEITVPAVERDGRACPDTCAPAYVDAVSGGMYSAMKEFAIEMLAALQTLEEGQNG